MIAQRFSGLKSEDMERLLHFSMSLTANLKDIPHMVLGCIQDIFHYNSTSYVVFNDDVRGNHYVSEVYSNYFPTIALELYQDTLHKFDPGYEHRETRRVSNPSSFLTIDNYESGSASPFTQTMRQFGLNCQIVIGANVTASTPIHCLCIYKGQKSEEIEQYELNLLEAIGYIFSSAVSIYKKFHRLQHTVELIQRYLDEDEKPVAIYSPTSKARTYNQAFQFYAGRVSSKDSPNVRAFLQGLLASADFQEKESECFPGKDCTILLEQQGRQIAVDKHNSTGSGTGDVSYLITVASEPDIPKVNPTVFSRHQLTARETEVAILMVDGVSNPDMAKRLFISMPTLKTHIRNIYSKFGAASRADFLDAVRNG